MQIEVGQQEKKGRECEAHSTQKEDETEIDWKRSTHSNYTEKSIHIVVEYTQ